MGKIKAERDREFHDLDFEDESGLAARKSEGFSVLQESEKASADLEARVNALERRRSKAIRGADADEGVNHV